MKTSLLFIFFLLLSLICLQAQDCKAYVAYQEGTKSEVTSYDKKGKVTGLTQIELKSVDESGDVILFTAHVKAYDDKHELVHEGDLKYKCENGDFIIDMNSFLNEEQMKAFGDMEVKMTSEEIHIPTKCKVGDVLNDGYIKVQVVNNNSPVNMSFVISIENRKVEAIESVTTSAGTFECIKISQDIITKSIMSITMHSVEWYAEGVGNVKSESYRGDKLMGYTELTKLEKL